MRLRAGRGREPGERAAAPATADPHPASSSAPPSPDRTGPLLHPSLTRVLIAIRDLPLHQEVLDFAVRDGRIDVVATTTDAAQLIEAARDGAVDAVVCCAEVATAMPEGDWPPRSAARDVPAPRMYVVSPELSVPVLRRAIALGAEGAFRWPEERHSLVGQVRRRRHGGGTPGRDLGSAVAVHGARGGAGTTFIACQLAAALADRGVPTTLMDAGLAFSDVTAALGMPADGEARTISDLIPVVDEVTPEHLSRVLHEHSAGFRVLLGPGPEAAAGDADASLVQAALLSLKRSCRAVVVHTPRSADVVTRGALEAADAILLVTTLDLLSLYGAKRVIQRMEQHNVERLRVVVNKASRSNIAMRDVERVLGISATACVRFDAAVPRGQERGELLRPRAGRAARDIDRLAGWLLDNLRPAVTEVSDARSTH